MKTLNNGLQIEILKVVKNQSRNYRDDKCTDFADLVKVRFATGKIGLICSTEILN